MITVHVTGTFTEVRVRMMDEAQLVANDYGRRVKLFNERGYLGDLIPEVMLVNIGLRELTEH